MSDKYALEKHKNWINLLQPEGLVFAPKALLNADCIIPQSSKSEQDDFLDFFEGCSEETDKNKVIELIFNEYLDYSESEFSKSNSFNYYLKEYDEYLGADYELKFKENTKALVKVVDGDFDRKNKKSPNGWETTEQIRFERLIRECQQEVGIMFNGEEIRLIFAPRGETSGFITFPITLMTSIDGRDTLYAFKNLLESEISCLF